MFWKKKNRARPRPYVEIDGDPFRIELITDINFAKLLQFCRNVDIPIFDRMADDAFLLTQGEDDRKLFLSNLIVNEEGNIEELGSYMGCRLWAHRRWEIHTLKDDRYWGFRPLLLPLNRDGSFAIDSDCDCNPNGTITMGGSLYLNGEPTQISKESIPKFDRDTTEIFLGDSVEGKELRWLHWNGCMFAMQALALCHTEDLFYLSGEPGERT